MGVIIYNGVSSRVIPIVVENPPDYTMAAKDYDVVHVLGKNGDVLIDNGSYQNVLRSYDIAFGSTMKKNSEMAAAVSEWLHSASGYARLEDSYEPDYYRMAYYQEEGDIENILNHLGRATINFNCMPQRFLKSGEKPIIFSTDTSTSGKLYNPTKFEAFPLLTIKGNGSAIVTINGTDIAIREIGGTIVIDCELGEAYYNSTSKNDMISWGATQAHRFPSLTKGLSNFNLSSGSIATVEVVPRWWTI